MYRMKKDVQKPHDSSPRTPRLTVARFHNSFDVTCQLKKEHLEAQLTKHYQAKIWAMLKTAHLELNKAMRQQYLDIVWFCRKHGLGDSACLSMIADVRHLFS